MTLHDIPLGKRPELAKGFRFGIEAEFLLCDRDTYRPLWHPDLKFDRLNSIFGRVPLDGLPSFAGLDLEPPMKAVLPFVIEGYHLPDMDFRAFDVLPKGVEIRTPICSSVEQVLGVYRVLHERLERALHESGYSMVSLSHHPVETHFHGPQNKRRHDFWQWSMEVMTTYGPDINISLPAEIAPLLDVLDLEAKINHYGPSLAALTTAAPFCGGRPWLIRGNRGKSFRMHKRSYIAPPIEIHPDEANRLEFKLFDMPNSIAEFEAQILAFLALILDFSLEGRASKQSRIYDLGQVARFGLEAETVRERATELLKRAPRVLGEWAFSPAALDLFWERLRSGRTPADDMIALFDQRGCLEDVLRARGRFDFASITPTDSNRAGPTANLSAV